MNIYEFISGLSDGRFDEQLKMLYGASEKSVLRNRARYLSAAENFSKLYPRMCGYKSVFGIGQNRGGRQSHRPSARLCTGGGCQP